jgi:serine phosphatase RsbU (regulator of sigma subunit)
MKHFFTIFQIIIFVILVSNPLLLNTFDSSSKTTKLVIFVFLAIFEFLVIIFLIKKYYHNPIRKLELTLKHFLVWNLGDSEVKFDKTLNFHLNYILSFFSKTINTLKNIKDEFIHGKEIKWEVELAKEIQWKMISKDMVEIPSIEIVMKSKPAWEIGGDSHDIIKQEDDYYIYVWDATGHWVWAWFIMVMVNALVSSLSKIYKSWADILIKTNDELKPRVKANLLMSMLLLRWNEKEKRLFMTWAGHEYLMIYKNSTWKVYRIKSGWVALGMIKDIWKLIKEQEIKFEKWDIAVLYSDWITEAINTRKRDGTEDIFWELRLEEAIRKAAKLDWESYKTARSVFNSITIQLSKFMWYKFTQLDDITLAVIQYKPDGYDVKQDFSTDISKDFVTEWYWD